eukprot:6200410-Pleurochrysis_carterae.AAC.3
MQGQPVLIGEGLELLGERVHAREHRGDIDEVGIAEGVAHQDLRYVQIERLVVLAAGSLHAQSHTRQNQQASGASILQQAKCKRIL